jgi:hypothetical protein
MFRPEFLDQIPVARLLMPKAEIVAHHHGLYAQLFHQEMLDEILGRPKRDLAGERKNQHVLDSFPLHQFHAAFEGSDQTRRTLGRHNFRRVRLESEHGGLPPSHAPDLRRRSQQNTVSRVDAVEIPDRQGG